MIAPKIMVVEDEEPLGVLLRYNLESEGYQVEVVTRAREVGATFLQKPLTEKALGEFATDAARRLTKSA